MINTETRKIILFQYNIYLQMLEIKISKVLVELYVIFF